MTDRLTPAQRSQLMSKVRRMLHAMGLRFRLHRRNLPRTPIVVLPRGNAIVLVSSCFHGHQGRRDGRRIVESVRCERTAAYNVIFRECRT